MAKPTSDDRLNQPVATIEVMTTDGDTSQLTQDDIGDIYSWLLFMQSADSLQGRSAESLREEITDKLKELARQFKQLDESAKSEQNKAVAASSGAERIAPSLGTEPLEATLAARIERAAYLRGLKEAQAIANDHHEKHCITRMNERLYINCGLAIADDIQNLIDELTKDRTKEVDAEKD